MPAVDGLAESVGRVMDDHDRWRAAARQRAERRFTRESWLARHDAIFRHLVEQG